MFHQELLESFRLGLGYSVSSLNCRISRCTRFRFTLYPCFCNQTVIRRLP
jgi:hypothetical protein